jgi:hypothetical protein
MGNLNPDAPLVAFSDKFVRILSIWKKNALIFINKLSSRRTKENKIIEKEVGNSNRIFCVSVLDAYE